jgi:hypothetical protein
MNYRRFRQRRRHQIQRDLDWKEVKVILRYSCNSNPISFSLIFTTRWFDFVMAPQTQSSRGEVAQRCRRSSPCATRDQRRQRPAGPKLYRIWKAPTRAGPTSRWRRTRMPRHARNLSSPSTASGPSAHCHRGRHHEGGARSRWRWVRMRRVRHEPVPGAQARIQPRHRGRGASQRRWR